MTDASPAERQPTIAQQWGRFGAALAWDDIPAAARERARLQLLDVIGAMFASTSFDFAHRTLAGLIAFGPGDSDVVGMPARLALRDAVLMNGILAHGLELDDSHTAARTHVSGATVPCAIGMAAHVGASGRELLTAYVLGMEAAIRIGMAAKGGFQATGWHPTGVVNTFGCALVAGKLLDLTAQQLTMAQGIALATAAGSNEFVPEAAWTKRMHAGWSGTGGITSAMLARHGFTGATTVYEGGRGLYKLYLDERVCDVDVSLATAGMGEVWEIANVTVKPLPACHFVHAHIHSTLNLVEKHGIRPQDVERITALMPRAGINLVCEPQGEKRRPFGTYGAQFSIYYAIANALVRGRFVLDDVDPTAITDPAVLAIADRVEYRLDTEGSFPKHYSGGVVIRLKDGREFTERENVNQGSPEWPMDEQAMVAKFRANTERVMAKSRTDRLVDLVLSIDRQGDARTLSRAIGGLSPD